jgi:hypothetical protein
MCPSLPPHVAVRVIDHPLRQVGSELGFGHLDVSFVAYDEMPELTAELLRLPACSPSRQPNRRCGTRISPGPWRPTISIKDILV